jgi:shikimate kinase
MSDSTPIFLVGFMGAGKTTVGRELARHLNYDFLDLDDVIVARAGKSVQEIFADLGEAQFRSLESAAIRSCADIERSVVALGGGAYVQKQNRVLLREIGKTVWLDCPTEICLKRISGDESRPLLGEESQMHALAAQRRRSYAQADLVIQTSDRSPQELAIEIARMLKGLRLD